MNKEYITKEVDKIISDKKYPSPQNFAMACAWIMGNFKALNLKILDVKKLSSLADYFILASTTNPVQSSAIADEIVMQLKKHQRLPVSREGQQSSDWILIDLGDIIVHIFSEHSRDLYNLDELWQNAPTVDIPSDYYIPADDQGPFDSGTGYF